MLSKYFKRNFSVFGRLKQYMKSSADIYNISSNVGPDDIKAQYEEIQSVMDRKQMKKELEGNIY
jgi:hypothetical protein